jgi:dGTPase
MPADWEAQLSDFSDTRARARLVADYIAGMTDRFAQQEHDRLFGAR